MAAIERREVVPPRHVKAGPGRDQAASLANMAIFGYFGLGWAWPVGDQVRERHRGRLISGIQRGVRMAGGGARSGAGRKPGGISESKRRLVAGMERGMARAAKIRGLPGETQDELVIEAVADIAQGMLESGQGVDLIKIYGAMAYNEHGLEGGGKSTLEQAMELLPGRRAGPGPAQRLDAGPLSLVESTGYLKGAPDTVSEAPGTAQESAPPKRPRLPGQESLQLALEGPEPPASAQATGDGGAPRR